MKYENRADSADNSRRDFLKKAGKLAIYTPPAMMVMMKPSHASFTKSGGTISYDRIRDSYNELSSEERDKIRSSWHSLFSWLRSLFR